MLQSTVSCMHKQVVATSPQVGTDVGEAFLLRFLKLFEKGTRSWRSKTFGEAIHGR